jgi:hypothetical protein
MQIFLPLPFASVPHNTLPHCMYCMYMEMVYNSIWNYWIVRYSKEHLSMETDPVSKMLCSVMVFTILNTGDIPKPH